MTIARGAATVAFVAIAAGCSGSELSSSTPPKAAASAKTGPREKLPYPSPARWAVHPYPPSYAVSAVRLGAGGCLLVEANGQRWTTRRLPENTLGSFASVPSDPLDDASEYEGNPVVWQPATGCTGEGTAAAERPPEEIRAIVRWPGAYGFVGASGVVHVARWPLGPIVRRILPPEPLLRVKSVGRGMLAISKTGRVYRWDEATGYERADLGDVHALDLGVGPSGRAAILAAPEALFTTEDGGRHFQRADAPSVGAQRLAVSESGRILVQGAISSLAWDPREPPAFALTSEPLVEAQLDISIQPGRYGGAAPFGQSRAVIDGDVYWETNINDESDWSLFRGNLGGALTEVPIPSPPSRYETQNVLVTARGKHVAIGALRWVDTRNVLELEVSHDGGKSYGPFTRLLLATQAPVGLAMSPEGTVFLTGVCLDSNDENTDSSATADQDDSPCAGEPFFIRPDGALSSPKTALSGDPATSPAYSRDGRSAYFVSGDPSAGTAALHVSRDGGLTFEERPLEIDDGDQRVTLSVLGDTGLSVSENGVVGGVFEATGDINGSVYLTADADGKNLHVSEPPDAGSLLAGFGDRVIALSHSGAYNVHSRTISESLDGGRTWAEVPAPDVIHDAYLREGDMQCGASGCFVGDSAARIGWGGGRDEPVPFEPPEPPAMKRPMRTPIVCEPRKGSAWTSMDSGEGSLFPDESDAERGAAAWTVYSVDPETGEVTSISAKIPEKPGDEPQIVKKRLLAPSPKKKGYAFSMRSQIEGISLARLPIDIGENLEPYTAIIGKHASDLEVAWENVEEGSVGHGRIDDAGTFGYNGVYRTDLPYLGLSMAMLSVSPKGIFVRVTEQSPSAFFIDTKGKVRRFAFPEWPERILGNSRLSSRDVVNVDGTFIVTADLYTASTEAPSILFFLRPPPPKSKPGEPWTPWSTMLAPPNDYPNRRYTSTNWTYEDGRYSVYSIHAVPQSSYATAWIQSVQSDGTLGPPRRVPTPYDLDATPRGCTLAEHKGLPRLRYGFDRGGGSLFDGLRHPVLVHDPTEPELPAPPAPVLDTDAEDPAFVAGPSTTVTAHPVYPPPSTVPLGRQWILSNGVVMRGKDKSACLDALVGRAFDNIYRAVVIGGDLSHAWYFRLASALPVKRKPPVDELPGRYRTATHVEARPLTCHYAPGMAVPADVFDANLSR